MARVCIVVGTWIYQYLYGTAVLVLKALLSCL